jgi:hypothetical protein
MPFAIDKKAKDILFKTYWRASGWNDKPHTDPADFAYAKAKGVMFDPVSFSHDECLADILTLRERIAASIAARAFLGSLSSRRLDWRSGVVSHYIAQRLSPHSYTPVESGRSYGPGGEVTHVGYTCGVCRDTKDGVVGRERYACVDVNVLNFERLKWGGVRHGQLDYTWFDLQQLACAEIPDPTAQDIAIFKSMLEVVAASEAGDHPGTLEKNLASVIASSKNERRMLIEILACIEVLLPRSRDRAIHGRSDWVYAALWRGEDGYSVEAVRRWFGAYL